MKHTPLDPTVHAATLAALGNWVAAIADRVKNPISGLVAALDIVEERTSGQDPVVADSLDRMRERLLSLNTYVSELIAFAQPAAPQCGPWNVAEIAHEASQRLRPGTPENAIISYTVPKDLVIHADRTMLVRIIVALMDNALHAVPFTRAPIVHLLVRDAHDARGALVKLTVDDNGPGIPASLHNQIFEPFFTTKEAGTGLGLAIARKYVEAQGGTIHTTTSPSLQGARFEVSLPLGGAQAGDNRSAK